VRDLYEEKRARNMDSHDTRHVCRSRTDRRSAPKLVTAAISLEGSIHVAGAA